MRLTLHTDYALRLLMYLAVKPDGRATIREVAKPAASRATIWSRSPAELGHSRLRRNAAWSRRRPAPGASGGRHRHRQGRARDGGGDFRLVECFDPQTDRCRIGPSCRLKRLLREALEAYMEVLGSATLADLVEKPKPLRRLLALTA